MNIKFTALELFIQKILRLNYIKEKIIIEELCIKPNHIVLDYGCGTGFLSTLFCKEQYYGVDKNENFIKFASRNFKGSFFKADGKTTPFINNFFDYIFVITVFHHVGDAKINEILAELKRVLKDDGKIIVLEPIDENRGILMKLEKLFKKIFLRSIDSYNNIFSLRFNRVNLFKKLPGVAAFLLEK